MLRVAAEVTVASAAAAAPDAAAKPVVTVAVAEAAVEWVERAAAP